MFGWELPPYNSGGLGTASLGMTQGLAARGVDIDFVLPHNAGPYPYKHMRILSASNNETDEQPLLQPMPYGSSLAFDEHGRASIRYQSGGSQATPYLQATWYAQAVRPLVQPSNYAMIHAHDWMTYYSAMQARTTARKWGIQTPLVAHIHATEYDRGGEHGGNQAIATIERTALQAADRVIAVSHYTAQMVHKHYDVPLRNISVVHNGIDPAVPVSVDFTALKKHYKIVLFMGRITMSKGPEYFLKLAQAVTARDPKVKFVMIGSGDMEKGMIEQAARMELTGKILFSSFLRGADVDRAYQLADLFVMPSVSEPFGLVALEALRNGTPAIVSKQSGVAEVSKYLVKVDFWDTDKMRDTTLHLLHHPQAAQDLRLGGQADLSRLSWAAAAEKIEAVYQELLPKPRLAYA